MKRQFKFHVVYMTTNDETGKFYIGKHSTNDLNDGYQGSGLWVKRSLNAGSKLTTRILGVYETEKQAYQSEIEYIAAFRIDCPDMIMNFTNGGEGWSKGMPFSPEVRAKMSKAHKGRKRTWAEVRGIAGHNKKWVVCMRTGEVYRSAFDCAKVWGVSASLVSSICLGNRPNSKHKFEYMD